MLYHKRIRDLREDNNISQQEIADFIGIDRVTYNRLENEKFSIKLDYAIKIAKKYDKKVIAFSGVIGKDAEILNKHGIDAYFPILRKITTENEALNPENAYKNLYSTALQVFRLLK